MLFGSCTDYLCNTDFLRTLFSLKSDFMEKVSIILPEITIILFFGVIVVVQLPMQSVPITTKVVSTNSAQPQHYVIKFVSYLRHVNGFLRVLRFPPPVKLTTTI